MGDSGCDSSSRLANASRSCGATFLISATLSPTGLFSALRTSSPSPAPEQLRAPADYLTSEDVPFLVCVIAEYHDPLGKYHNGVPEMVSLADSPEAVNALH